MAEPSARYEHYSAAVSGKEVLVYGGYSPGDEGGDSNFVHLFSVETEKWRKWKGAVQHPPAGQSYLQLGGLYMRHSMSVH